MKPPVAFGLGAVVGLAVAYFTLHSRETEIIKAAQSRVSASDAKARQAELDLRRAQEEAHTIQPQPRLLELESKLAAVSSELRLLRARSSTSNPMPPNLAAGSYAFEQDAVIYSPDAKLRLKDGLTVSSPTGVMVSDPNQKLVVGDLEIQTANGGIMRGDGVSIVDTVRGRVTVRGGHLRFTTSQQPNQAPEPTATAVTSPAAQEPRQP